MGSSRCAGRDCFPRKRKYWLSSYWSELLPWNRFWGPRCISVVCGFTNLRFAKHHRYQLLPRDLWISATAESDGRILRLLISIDHLVVTDIDDVWRTINW